MADAEDAVANAIAAFAELDGKTMLDSLVAVLGERPEVLQGLVDWAVPEHAFVPSKVITDHRFEGTIKSFSEKNFFGFVDSPSHKEYFGNDVFAHGAQLGNLSYVGAQVNFAVFLNKDHKPQAFDVHPGSVADYQKKGQGQGGKAAAKGVKGAWDAAPVSAKGSVGKAAYKGAWDAAPVSAKGSVGKAAYQAPSGWDSAAPRSTVTLGAGNRVTAVAGGAAGGAGKGWGGDAWSDSAKGRLGPGQRIGGPDLKGGGKSKDQAPMKGGGKASADKGAFKGGKAYEKGFGGKGKDKGPVTTRDMPGVTDGKRFTGMMKSYSEKNGFGFIICPEIAEIFQAQLEVFVHRMQVGNFRPGDEVNFGVIINKDGKPQAVDMQPVGGRGAGGAPPAKRQRIEEAHEEEAYRLPDEDYAPPDEAYEEFAGEAEGEAW